MRISLPPELPVALNTEEPDPQPDEAKPVSRETVCEKMLDILAKLENCSIADQGASAHFPCRFCFYLQFE